MYISPQCYGPNGPGSKSTGMALLWLRADSGMVYLGEVKIYYWVILGLWDAAPKQSKLFSKYTSFHIFAGITQKNSPVKMTVAVYAPKWPPGSGKPPLTWVTPVTGTFQWGGASPGKGDCCSASNSSPNHGFKRLSREWPNSSRRWSPGYSPNQILTKLNHLLPVRDAGLLLGSKCSLWMILSFPWPFNELGQCVPYHGPACDIY